MFVTHIHISQTLIEKGADVAAVDKDGWTALHFAAQNGHHESIKVKEFDW